ncbi:MAG: proprotein convertase P-domain-containing protein, partial [Pirellulales bacterium]|nr:proprotein convertase P-domain-containing protein [Pirellulales bacterium]
VAEVKQAILSSAATENGLNGRVSTGGRLDLGAAINADVFAPAARLVEKQDIRTSGVASSEFTIEYSHRDGVDPNSLGDDDVIVTRQWGPEQQLSATFVSSTTRPDGTVEATYFMKAPGAAEFRNDTEQSMGVTGAIVSPTAVTGISEMPTPFQVDINLPVTDLRDLLIQLVDPGGHTFTLYSPGSRGGFALTETFGDESPLQTANPNGTWRLMLQDTNPGVVRPPLVGTTLASWSLRFGPDFEPASFDPLDFGDYVISTEMGSVKTVTDVPIGTRNIGSFNVRIEDDPSVLYVDTLADPVPGGEGSLRESIIAANAAMEPRTIILDSGTYTIDQPHQADPNSPFPNPDPRLFCSAAEHTTGWSNATTGDFDIESGAEITIVGDRSSRTIIDARGIDRVFKVHENANLDLTRVTVAGGVSPADQGGGGILSAGDVVVHQSIVRDNEAVAGLQDPIRGGGLAAWGGSVTMTESLFDSNSSDYGGGVFLCDTASATVSHSTLSNNLGGGLHSHSDRDIEVSNSTFSANTGGQGAIFNGKRDGFSLGRVSDRVGDGLLAGQFQRLSEDGRFLAFVSSAGDIVPGDNNGRHDIFVYERATGRVDRVSVSSTGAEANNSSSAPSISADGRFVAFDSVASNLIPGDTAEIGDIGRDVFVYDRQLKLLERVSVDSDGNGGNSESKSPSISADGRFVAFLSDANNLVPGDNTGTGQQGQFDHDVFVHDRQTGETRRVSVSNSGDEANESSFEPKISGNGRFVAFASSANNLLGPGNDTNGEADVFVYDLETS